MSTLFGSLNEGKNLFGNDVGFKNNILFGGPANNQNINSNLFNNNSISLFNKDEEEEDEKDEEEN